MPTHDIICIGASAGGVEALQRLVSFLPADLAVSVFVILHMSPDFPSMLPSILTHAGNLPALRPSDKSPIEHKRIYVAPPNYHMILERGRLRLIHGRKENRHRPAIDPLFRSAAAAYRSRVVGVVLSGNLDDGSAGLMAVKACGGTTVVQDADEALFPDMPANALKNAVIDYRLTVRKIAELLIDLASRPAPDAPDLLPPRIQTEVEFSKMKKDIDDMSELGGAPTVFACPSCHGALWELKNGKLSRYRCQTGHAFSPESLLAEQSDAIRKSIVTRA